MMTEGQFLELLRGRYDRKAYALIPQVRNGTGFERGPRTADALAVSLWPSRGIGVEGFEFKDSRSDWMKELKQPEKGEEIGRFCCRWWVVVSDESIIRDGELPGAWGMLAAKADKLKVIKQAPDRDIVNPTWLFVAAVLKAAMQVVIPDAEIERRIDKARADATSRERERMEERNKREIASFQNHQEKASEVIRKFNETSGLNLYELDWGHAGKANQRLAEAVKFVMGGGLNGLTSKLKEIAESAESIQSQARSVIALEAIP